MILVKLHGFILYDPDALMASFQKIFIEIATVAPSYESYLLIGQAPIQTHYGLTEAESKTSILYIVGIEAAKFLFLLLLDSRQEINVHLPIFLRCKEEDFCDFFR